MVFMPGIITVAISVRSRLPRACKTWGSTVTAGQHSGPRWEHVNFSTNDSCLSSDFILRMVLSPTVAALANHVDSLREQG